MRQAKVFAGSSHPELASLITQRLGIAPAPCKLGKYLNSETSVSLDVSVRNQDVYIIQSGSLHSNDHLMELLVLINSCKIASAKRITAVLPYFPYSKQSKMRWLKKRCAITAKLVANMLVTAGVDHIITMDLHAAQMQGFFQKPVDNLFAEPTLAKWLKDNIPDGNGLVEDVVVVAKNAGGAKRVTALADKLGVLFALIHLEAVKPPPQQPIPIQSFDEVVLKQSQYALHNGSSQPSTTTITATSTIPASPPSLMSPQQATFSSLLAGGQFEHPSNSTDVVTAASMILNCSPTAVSSDAYSNANANTNTNTNTNTYPLPSSNVLPLHRTNTFSTASGDPQPALLGNARGKLALLVDDIIDKGDSFITAANFLINHCGAKAVYVVAIHGIFSGSTLQDLENCKSISKVVATNTFPLEASKKELAKKLNVVDISAPMAEAIRRHHNAESISFLFSNAI
ncbi:phosphoribosyl pyrophosphokinase [Ramicandelaber brevisporus]|nr:phosphoribosyl pyrophosphokinase [Ramicandelaber brevisporus]